MFNIILLLIYFMWLYTVFPPLNAVDSIELITFAYCQDTFHNSDDHRLIAWHHIEHIHMISKQVSHQ